MNKAILSGNLGADPELRYLPDGKAVVSFSVATTDRWNDKQTGEKKERTEWHRVVAFGPLAEMIGKNASKGTSVNIDGSIRTRNWEKDGIKRYSTEIVIDMKGSFEFVGSRQDNDSGDRGSASRGGNSPADNSAPAAPQDDFNDDIPF